MRSALSMLLFSVALVGCGRVVALDCRDVPERGTMRQAACPSGSPVLCRDPESGQRCVPAAAICWPDESETCQASLGVTAPGLEIVCLDGEYDEAEVLRTTPSCSDLTSAVDAGE